MHIYMIQIQTLVCWHLFYFSKCYTKKIKLQRINFKYKTKNYKGFNLNLICRDNQPFELEFGK